MFSVDELLEISLLLEMLCFDSIRTFYLDVLHIHAEHAGYKHSRVYINVRKIVELWVLMTK